MTFPPPDRAEVEAFASARRRVLDAIADASARAGRDPATVTLVAVSKTVPAARLRAAAAAGLTRLGENRVQEASAKAAEVPGVRWELVGPLQSNKARAAVATFERIQTVDSVALAHRLGRLAAELRPGTRLPVLVQVNVDRDPAKAGVMPEDVEALLAAIGEPSPGAAADGEASDVGEPGLEVEGLMTVGRLASSAAEARRTFAALRELGVALRARVPSLGPQLSMGMSDDYPLAVEEGATIVRVGRALFGERPRPPSP